MPRKDKTTESVVQNRDNQRRSRARRRELVDELQRRVADYERQGAQATMEMQRAARAVAAENQRLRALLGQCTCGLGAHMLLLKSEGSDGDSESSCLLRRGPNLDTVEDEPGRTELGAPRRTELGAPRRTELESGAPGRTELKSGVYLGGVHGSADGGSGHGGVDHGSSGGGGICHGDSAYGGVGGGGGGAEQRGTLETSCDEAVGILTELQLGRRQVDAMQARAALGCDDGASACLVRNTRLFQVMDEIS